MRRLFKMSAAPIAALGALTFVAIAAPTSAHADGYCRRDVTSYMLTCGFDNMAQCQATSSGRGGDCLRDPHQGSCFNGKIICFEPDYSKAAAVNSAYAYAPGYSRSQGRRGNVKATIENR
jgi:hypothetical protein